MFSFVAGDIRFFQDSRYIFDGPQERRCISQNNHSPQKKHALRCSHFTDYPPSLRNLPNIVRYSR